MGAQTQWPVSSENTISLSYAHIWLQTLPKDQQRVSGQGILNRFLTAWNLFSSIFFLLCAGTTGTLHGLVWKAKKKPRKGRGCFGRSLAIFLSHTNTLGEPSELRAIWLAIMCKLYIQTLQKEQV